MPAVRLLVNLKSQNFFCCPHWAKVPQREGAAIHPILNSSSHVRHQTKHKRRLWCYLWIRNFHSLKVKQTGGEEAFWPPHTLMVSHQKVYLSFSSWRCQICWFFTFYRDTDNDAALPALNFWHRNFSDKINTWHGNCQKYSSDFFYPRRNSVSKENQQFATFN